MSGFEDDRCPCCFASRAEIRHRGHNRIDSMGRPTATDGPNQLPCPEACTCIPEHFSMDEHRKEYPDA